MTEVIINRLGHTVSLLLLFSGLLAGQDSWKTTEEAAARAARAARFDEAEKLLSANLKSADALPPKDPRRPRTLFDLAEIDRAEGKYSHALPLYERALQVYTTIYGAHAAEVADVLNGEAELYKSLNDYTHAEPLLVRSCDRAIRILPKPKTISASSTLPPEPSIRQNLC